MAVDYFLQIDGIAGESQDAKHKGAIDVLSWSFGESNAAPVVVGGGAGAGKVTFSDFNFMTPVSKASPALFLACATGQHFKTAKLSAQKAGAKAADDYLTWTFTDVLVSSYQTSAGGGDEGPMESVSLNAARAVVSYKSQKPDGSFDVAVTAGFDVKTNTKV
jgi:type VI secretion system secreted protein Hcp